MLTTAFALEGVADEVVFMVGPVLVTVLATAVHPAAGLAAAIGCGALGGVALVAQRSTAPPHRGRTEPTAAGAMAWSRLAPLCVVTAGLGCLFGAMEVVTVAFAEEAGNRGYAGWLLAVWAAGSMVAGLVLGALPGRGRPLRRLRLGAALLLVSVAAASLAASPLVLGVLLLASGLTIAPTLVAATSLAATYSPAGRLTEGITWMETGLVVGVAPGAAFAVPVAGGVLAAAAAWMIREFPARRRGGAGREGQTVDMSPAPTGAGSGRRHDA